MERFESQLKAGFWNYEELREKKQTEEPVEKHLAVGTHK